MTTAARIREILEHVGLVQESLPPNVVSSSQVLANVANLLNIRDTELSRCVFVFPYVHIFIHRELHSAYKEKCYSFLVAMADLSLRKTAVEEKRAKVQQESKELLDYTRKAIARLTYLKRWIYEFLFSHLQIQYSFSHCQTLLNMHNVLVNIRTLSQLEDDIPPCEAQMEHWKTNLAIMESKERQYLQQYSNYKVTLCYQTSCMFLLVTVIRL